MCILYTCDDTNMIELSLYNDNLTIKRQMNQPGLKENAESVIMSNVTNPCSGETQYPL